MTLKYIAFPYMPLNLVGPVLAPVLAIHRYDHSNADVCIGELKESIFFIMPRADRYLEFSVATPEARQSCSGQLVGRLRDRPVAGLLPT
jgi:hypothetical protein